MSETTTILTVNSVSKSYPNISGRTFLLKELWSIVTGRVNQERAKQVLSEVDFTVKKGESLAIVGRNGAGKSTLLKIISGVINATQGTVSLHGSLGALLELGAGFDLEQTGRQNLIMAAQLAGIAGKDMASSIAQMEEFADIGDAVEQEVKTYSSGMVVRLGFAVITVTRPDLLITDEVLAVGDEAFQMKCLAWIDEYLASGGTLLLVSHSMYHVQKICQKALWLEQGKMRAYGNVFEVSRAYKNSLQQQQRQAEKPQVNKAFHHILEVKIENDAGEQVSEFAMRENINCKVKMFSPDGTTPGLGIGLVPADDKRLSLYGTLSELHKTKASKLDEHTFEYQVTFPQPPLLPGHYQLNFHTMTPEHLQLIDTVEIPLAIVGESRELGFFRLPTIWSQ